MTSSGFVSQSASAESNDGCVLLFDLHSLRRRGLALLLTDWLSEHGLVLVEAPSLEEIALDEVAAQHPRLALFALGGARLAGLYFDTISWVGEQMPGLPRVIIADGDDIAEIVAAFKLGVNGYISTNIEPEAAKQTLSFILNGGSYFPPSAILHMAQKSHTKAPSNGETDQNDKNGLTRRQQDVLHGIVQGKSNKVIARDLLMQESTVKVHVRQILRKLGAANRTQAALLATNLTEPARTDQRAPPALLDDMAVARDEDRYGEEAGRVCQVMVPVKHHGTLERLKASPTRVA